ncbi:MAG: PLP-dependent aminotransferase family protein [Chlorobi bacterium]|nr:PLP-dependent aminotransferase family protein [Chlorobiota bacterium]
MGFEYPYARGVAHLKSSDIRDLMKYAIDPRYISFAGGMPNNRLFPVDEVEEIYRRLPRKEKETAFQYGPTTGYPPLREAVKEYMASKGIPADSHDVMITTGSLQGIYIVSQLFLDPGDTVLAENPTFIGALTLFKSFQARTAGVPMDEHGILPERLEKAFERHPEAKFLYVIPNFHNPAGLIYSPRRRRYLLDFIRKNKLVLLEDDAYNELYFDEADRPLTRPVLSMADPDTARQIIYAGTFSKIFGPGFRLGWLVLPREVFPKAEIVKQSLDACSPNFSQVIANTFMREGYMKAYLERIRPEYRLRRDLILQAMEKHFPPGVRYVRPKGGFYVWVELPDGVPAARVLDYALENGVVFVLGKSFAPDDSLTSAFRLAYSNVDPEQIEPGIRVIGEGIRRAMARAQNPG